MSGEALGSRAKTSDPHTSENVLCLVTQGKSRVLITGWPFPALQSTMYLAGRQGYKATYLLLRSNHLETCSSSVLSTYVNFANTVGVARKPGFV